MPSSIQRIFCIGGGTGHPTAYTDSMGFHLVVNYRPKGDQATAIEELVRGVRNGCLLMALS